MDFSPHMRHAGRFRYATVGYSHRRHPPAEYHRTRKRVVAFAHPCAPVTRQTRPLVGALNPRCGHHVRKPTAGPCAFCRCPASVPEQRYPRYVSCLALTGTGVADRTAVPAVHRPRRTSDPESHGSAPRSAAVYNGLMVVRHVLRELRRDYARQQSGSRVVAL